MIDPENGPGQFAAISDIHGNLLALDAVLDDMSRRGIGPFVNLGDHLQGPLDPLGTAERLMLLDAPSIRGNCDRLLYEPDSAAAEGSTVFNNRRLLAGRHRRWLEEMPQTFRFQPDVLLCHGNPWADDVYLLEEVSLSTVRIRLPAELAANLAGVDATLILCGHSHVPRAVQVSPGKLVVNVGSVGLPAYIGENPPHAMEAGSPHARYSILTRTASGWIVDQIAVPYDWESAAKLAEHNGRPDWARWLRTGRA